MAEVTENESPNRALGQDLLPGHLGSFPLHSARRKSTLEHTDHDTVKSCLLAKGSVLLHQVQGKSQQWNVLSKDSWRCQDCLPAVRLVLLHQSAGALTDTGNIDGWDSQCAEALTLLQGNTGACCIWDASDIIHVGCQAEVAGRIETLCMACRPSVVSGCATSLKMCLKSL